MGFFRNWLAGMYEPKSATITDITTIEQNNNVGKAIWKANSENRSA